MRCLALPLCCLFPVPSSAQVVPDWSIFPGYFSPGGGGIVGFASDSRGDLVVSDGSRLHRISGNAIVASSSIIGSALGFRNLGELSIAASNLVVYIGGDQSVNRITMPAQNNQDSLFAKGFENP